MDLFFVFIFRLGWWYIYIPRQVY